MRRPSLPNGRRRSASIRIAQLERRFIPGGYGLPHLQATHRYIFAEIYPWAGELRTRADQQGRRTCSPCPSTSAPISRGARRLAGEDRSKDWSREQFVERLTHYYAEINAVHPFREGNGRAQRAFLGQIAKAAGHPITWARLDAERNVDAARESHRGNNSLLWGCSAPFC